MTFLVATLEGVRRCKKIEFFSFMRWVFIRGLAWTYISPTAVGKGID